MITNQLYLIASSLLIFYSTLSLFFAFYFRLCLKKHADHIDASVTIILPFTGHHHNFKNLLYLLERQTLKPKRLIVSIESESDLAYALAKSIVPHVSFPVDIVIAGLSHETAQKCHNLVAAIKNIELDNGYVVLIDVDIMPPTWWLSAAIKPLLNKEFDIVSGYRWQMPSKNCLAEHLISFIDRSIAIAPRPPGLPMIWGGTIAMPCSMIKEILAERILESALTDDLSIAEFAYKKGFKILNRRILLVPSTPSTTFLKVWDFAVRQLQIIKVYRPNLWRFEFVRSSFLVLLWIAFFTQFNGNVYFAKDLLIILLLLLFKQLILLNIASYLGYSVRLKFNLYQCGLIFLRPLIDFYIFCVLCMSIHSRVVKWSHVTYLVLSRNVIKVRSRH